MSVPVVAKINIRIGSAVSGFSRPASSTRGGIESTEYVDTDMPIFISINADKIMRADNVNYTFAISAIHVKLYCIKLSRFEQMRCAVRRLLHSRD